MSLTPPLFPPIICSLDSCTSRFYHFENHVRTAETRLKKASRGMRGCSSSRKYSFRTPATELMSCISASPANGSSPAIGGGVVTVRISKVWCIVTRSEVQSSKEGRCSPFWWCQCRKIIGTHHNLGEHMSPSMLGEVPGMLLSDDRQNLTLIHVLWCILCHLFHR